ncbi:ribonuclease HII [Patescibacteria group bacterium]|nr:ribonuclease HII [Patescibacteria group bacterium]MBU0777194.1 ribonuclease HII [Patescibacteria group bacterium]MBU0845889.1 ribonuclease HII [Patescibacteria group bacterium]MBU0922916.1 ribonuclease HII [Patescibacteria group bacterium]MBU1066351.1 ribonuclease HII [Patescibacteria group bacterium]
MNLPNFSFEKRLWKKGFKFVAGLDEVGRGSFAGPVVAGCVVFKLETKIPKNIYINDSKKVTPKRRKIANEWIVKNALAWGTGEVSAGVINRIGMSKATQVAFRRAIENANKRMQRRTDYLLIDALFIPCVRGLPMKRKAARKNHNLKDGRGRQEAIVKGDQKSISIAAASIIAKVYRDNIMKALSERPRYKRYGWDRNKGYGTKEHGKAIKKFGISRYHRKKFVETFLSKSI